MIDAVLALSLGDQVRTRAASGVKLITVPRPCQAPGVSISGQRP
jgi:hypothetical protein